MKSTPLSSRRLRGFTLVELLVAIVITLVVVAAAGYIYINTRDTQRAIERTSASAETGAFVMQLIGRDLMNAGAYPTIMPPVNANFPTRRQFDSYPPTVGVPARTTDWISPANAYLSPVFGCDGGRFVPADGTCDEEDENAPDSLVINYFTSDPKDSYTGQRLDCTGEDVANDPSNAIRKLNVSGTPPTAVDPNLPPQLPLFASNRYVLVASETMIDGVSVPTHSLACAGNGKSPTEFMPIIAGIEDLQLTYGVFSTETSRVPDRFYKASDMAGLPTVSVDGNPLDAWQRVVAVRVCVMTQTLGSAPKIADKAGEERKYLNCQDQEVTQAANDGSLHKRYVEVFSLRNRMNQTY